MDAPGDGGRIRVVDVLAEQDVAGRIPVAEGGNGPATSAATRIAAASRLATRRTIPDIILSVLGSAEVLQVSQAAHRGTAPRAVVSTRRDARAERQAQTAQEVKRGGRMLGREGERPQGPFGPLPISELAILVGL